MQPTPRTGAWSAWAGWAAVPRDLLDARRVRLTVHELGAGDLRRDWARLQPPVALYTPKQLRSLIRDAIGRGPTAAPDRWHRPDPDAYWRVHDFLQNVRLERAQVPELGAGVGGGARGRGARAGGGWEGAAWGWAAGAMLLAVLVLLVRALERFLHRKLFKDRYGNDVGPPPRLDDSDTYPSDGREASGNDLPPPYSECANNDLHLETMDPDKPIGMEEPPPPYSACYFSNPKDGIPTVHFSRRSIPSSELGHCSTGPNSEPSISNTLGTESNKISDVGCELNVSLESNVARDSGQPPVRISSIAENEVVNAATIQEVVVRGVEQNADNVVGVVEPHRSQREVVAV